MSVHKIKRRDGTPAFVVRWREGVANRRRTFDRRRDADLWDAEVRRRRQLGALHTLDAGSDTLDEYVVGTWAQAHLPRLAPKTRRVYVQMYDRHVSPHLGSVALRDFTPETIKAWHGALARAGTGPEALHKAATLLGAILQLATEGQHIPYNPARAVRKPRRPGRVEVRPIAPERVEAMRAAVGRRDATILSVLAYAGLRPQELRTLRWRHVRDSTLLVYAGKTGKQRTVRLMSALSADLREWRMALGRPTDDALVFPDGNGGEWSINAFNKWRARVFAKALTAAGIDHARPYDLRHSFASLLLHEGRSPIYVARQLGHGAALTMGTYGHVIDELDDAPRIAAEDAIQSAREGGFAGARSSVVPLAAVADAGAAGKRP
ncbi:MAG: hypothetical protein E6G56_04470 [Actinobacteria bacterium]|nr:MAG: hypothetical protein E6G56_04470 [Actinomycetota bacterium]